MLVLVVVFLSAIYVLKIFMPSQFVMIIDNDKLAMIGTFIEKNKLMYYVFCGTTAFATYWLYCCACTHKKFLTWRECLLIVFVIAIVRLCGLYVDEKLSTIISWTSFMFLPAILNGNLQTCAIVLTTHSIAQGLSLSIRNLPLYLTRTNIIIGFALTIEMYLWLILFYIVFNGEKGDINMGQMAPPVYGKSKFYQRKKERALKRIAKNTAIIEICDKYLNENK